MLSTANKKKQWQAQQKREAEKPVAPRQQARPVSTGQKPAQARVAPRVQNTVEQRSAQKTRQAPGPSFGSTHTVAPSFETGHYHAETSMTGFEECPAEPSGKQPPSAPVVAVAPHINLQFGEAEMVKGMIYAEILGKPKALR